MSDYIELTLCADSLAYRPGDTIWYRRQEWRVEHVDSGRRLVLRRSR